MIEIKNLSLRQGAEPIHLRLQSNRVYGILGPSRAEKSALLSFLAGISRSDVGTVKINGFDLKAEECKAKKCVGYFAKELPLYEQMTPNELITFVAQARGLAYERILRKTREVLELAGLDSAQSRPIKQLSPIEKHKLGILLTTVGTTDTLLLDEPLCDLDEDEKEEICDLIRYLAEGRTVFVSDPTPTTLLPLCDRLLILSSGTVAKEIAPSEFSFSEYETLCESSRESDEASFEATPKKARKRRPEKDGEYELIEEEREGRR